jgi:hypothetical protein
MQIDLKSFNAKLGRATEHVKVFDSELKSWMDKKLYRLVPKTNADFTEHSLVYRCTEDLDKTRVSLVFGDAVHNLRSALDHLIYAVAATKSQGVAPATWKKIEKRIAFPICNSTTAFTEFCNEFGMVLTPGILDALKDFQPDNRGNPFLPPAIRLLRDLDDLDKHRLLPVIFSQGFEWEYNGSFGVVPPEAHPIQFFPYEGKLKDGVEVVTVKTQCPAPQLNMDGFKITIAILIAHDPGPTGITRSSCGTVYNTIVSEVETILASVLPLLS